MMVFGLSSNKMRGCFHEMSMDASASAGAVLSIYGDGSAASQANYLFVNSVSFAQKERFNVVQCFNDRNYVYAFGHDPLSSMVSVNYTAFLVDNKGSLTGNAIKTVLKGYDNNRLTKRLSRVNLHFAKNMLSGFIIGLDSATADPSTNLQNFTVTLLLTEPQKGV